MAQMKYRIGVLGYGAIGRRVVEAVTNNLVNGAEIVVVMVRNISKYQDELAEIYTNNILLTDRADVFFNCCPDLVVEAAGQEAVIQYGQRTLQAGSSLMVSSIGAFTDDNLYRTLTHAAAESSGDLYLIGGALPGVGWMQGAAIADVDEVKITQIKPVKSWLQTPAEDMVDLKTVQAPVSFFCGTAREAARIFKKSSNITAMLALSTIGLDQVQVDLVADPISTIMRTTVEFKGDAGELTLQWKGVPSSLNPSTSQDVALNVIKAIRNIYSPVKMGV